MKKAGMVASSPEAVQTLRPIAQELACVEYDIEWFVERTAIRETRDVPHCIIISGLDSITPRSDAEWDSLIQQHSPTTLFIGISQPLHAERKMALAANRLKIPVVACSNEPDAPRRLGEDVRIARWQTK